jgi:ABC-2 type transport system ATP-binding protein
MIIIEGLSKRFGAQQALDDLTMRVNAGRIYGLIGPNGAGKTTLMLILTALLRPDGGSVRVGEHEVTSDPAAARRLIGYMPDFFGVYDGLKTTEYLEFFAAAHGVPTGKRPAVIEKLLELVNLEDKAENYVDTLSRGMKQRLALARCLVHEPKVLILDEPASGLDPRARAEVKEIVRYLGRLGKTVLISSHILPELAEICDEIGIMEHGRLVAAGPVAEITGAGTSADTGSRRLHLEVAADAAEAAAAWLRERSEVSDLVLEGPEIRLVFGGGPEAQVRLLADLVGRGIPVQEFYEHRDNLETAFMAVTGEKRRGTEVE